MVDSGVRRKLRQLYENQAIKDEYGYGGCDIPPFNKARLAQMYSNELLQKGGFPVGGGRPLVKNTWVAFLKKYKGKLPASKTRLERLYQQFLSQYCKAVPKSKRPPPCKKTRYKPGRKKNPWNAFVRKHKGQGYTFKQLGVMYRKLNGTKKTKKTK